MPANTVLCHCSTCIEHEDEHPLTREILPGLFISPSLATSHRSWDANAAAKAALAQSQRQGVLQDKVYMDVSSEGEEIVSDKDMSLSDSVVRKSLQIRHRRVFESTN